ncbi:MAG TPA: phage tail terminator-like protein [Terriglobia bacterium]|nr:phage tail terminator-like protein [Terriglobia bacterium]
MASAAPAAVIEARLRAQFTAAPIRTANDPAADPDANDGPFVVLEFPGGTAAQITIGSPGSNLFRDLAVFMIHVFVPSQTGEQAARDMAATIAAIFRGKSFSGVDCWAPYPPQEDTGPNGNWFGVSFATPYKYDLLA